jgi:hypothetical protein
MGTLALTSLCIGAALGLRFRVFALFPVILLGFIVITVWGLCLGQAGWSIVLMNVVGATCLQFGYLGGTLPRFLIIAARLGRAENPQPVRPFAH